MISFSEISNLSIVVIVILLIVSILFILRSKRALLSKFLRVLTALVISISLLEPHLKFTRVIEGSLRIAMIDLSLSMTEDAVRDCNSQLSKAKYDKIYGFHSLLFDLSSDSQNLLKWRKSVSGKSYIRKHVQEVRSRFPQAEIILCSDGHDLSIESKSDSISGVETLYPNRVLIEPDIVSVKELYLPYFIWKSKPTTASVIIENSSSKSVDKQLILVSGKTELAKERIRVPARSSITWSPKVVLKEEGERVVELKIDGEESSQRVWVFVKRPKELVLYGASAKENTALVKVTQSLSIPLKVVNKTQLQEYFESKKEDTLVGVVLNNVPRKSLGQDLIKNISSYVKRGGDLLILGGDKSFGLGAYKGTELDAISPLKSVKPKKKVVQGSAALVLVVDKSRSMAQEGRMRAAKLAVLSSIYSLKDTDYVGVIAFDHAPLTIIELDTVKKVKPEAKARIRNLSPGKKTNLLPALALARLRLSQIKAAKKHVIVLSDGQFPPSSDAFVDEINRLRKNKVTVSTVALGVEADAPFMKLLARAGKGSFYQTYDASRLPKIFLGDIKVAVGEDTRKEGKGYRVSAHTMRKLFSRNGTFDPISGYVQTKLSKGAELFLQVIDKKVAYPLLAKRNVEEGTVVAFSSDLQSRWTREWFSKDSIGYFIESLIEQSFDITSADKREPFTIKSSVADSHVTIRLTTYESKLAKKYASGIPAYVVAKDFNKKIFFEQKEEGVFAAKFNVGAPGDYRIAVAELEKELGVARIMVHVPASAVGEKPVGSINFAFMHKNFSQDSKPSSSSPQSEHEGIPLQRYFIFLAGILLAIEAIYRERRL